MIETNITTDVAICAMKIIIPMGSQRMLPMTWGQESRNPVRPSKGEFLVRPKRAVVMDGYMCAQVSV